MTGLSVESILAAGHEAVLTVLVASAPPLAAALCVGLLVGVAQAATQVQDGSLGVVPRLAAVFLALGLGGPWIGAYLLRFAARCLGLALRAAP